MCLAAKRGGFRSSLCVFILICAFFIETHCIDVPYVTVHRSIINTREGDSAHLHCNYETSLDGTVSWLDNKGQTINSADHSKFTVHTKPSDKNTHISTLVVNNVNKFDLGDYICKVQNMMGAEDVNIQLTYFPEPPQLNATEQEGESVITHWHIRSLQPLTEVVLNYRKKGVSSSYFSISIYFRRTRAVDLCFVCFHCRKLTGKVTVPSITNTAKITLDCGSELNDATFFPKYNYMTITKTKNKKYNVFSPAQNQTQNATCSRTLERSSKSKE